MKMENLRFYEIVGSVFEIDEEGNNLFLETQTLNGVTMRMNLTLESLDSLSQQFEDQVNSFSVDETVDRLLSSDEVGKSVEKKKLTEEILDFKVMLDSLLIKLVMEERRQ